MFKFNLIFEQKHSTPTGSLISVVFAEFTMQHIVEIMLQNVPATSKIRRRYVDDIIAIIPKSQVNSYLEHMKNLNHHIKLTCKIENLFPVVDIKIVRNSSIQLDFAV